MSTLTPADQARIDRGEVLVNLAPVSGWKVPQLVVHAVIDAPPDKVWDVVEKSYLYDRFMPRIKKSEELMRDETGTRTRVTVEMPFPIPNLTATTRTQHTVVPGERWVQSWKMEVGDYKHNSGSWTLTPYNGDSARTLAVYQCHVVPKMPIPKRIQSGVQEKAMPKLIAAVRDEVRRRG